MRSNLFASTLAIALGVASLIVGAIGFPEMAVTQTVEQVQVQVQAERFMQQGIQQYQVSEFTAALQSWQKALVLYQQIKDQTKKIGITLRNIGLAHRRLGQYADALGAYQKALSNFRVTNARLEEAITTNNIGQVNVQLNMPLQALHEFQAAAVIFQEIGDHKGQYTVFNNIGLVYQSLGQYKKALDFFQKSQSINKDSDNRSSQLSSLLNIGAVYRTLGQCPKELEIYQRALKLTEAIGSKTDQALILNNIGAVYDCLGQSTRAIKFYQQAIPIFRIAGDRNNEAVTLMNLGTAFRVISQYDKSISHYQEALQIFQLVKDSEGEGILFNNLGVLMEQQKQSEIAIIFYKKSVNVREEIRASLHKLPYKVQESYTRSVASSYRSLANLLLSQGRVLEAQQVLELLKNQELRDYTKDTRSTSPTNGSPLNPLEAPIPAAFNDKISLGNQLTECDRQRCTDRSQLNTQVTNANKTFIALVTKLKDGLRSQEIKDPAQLQTDKLTIAAQKVILANPNVKTVLVYPLVLEDKLWLVWGSQAGKSGVIFDSKEIPVTRKDLSEKVRQLQEKLSNPNSNPKELQQVSQQLYQWLIQPIRQQLDDNKVQQIVFSLDRATRYIPMAALHDGKQYLIENFAISTILTAEIDTTDKLAPNPQDSPILGLGLTQAIAGLNALPAVETEINAIVRTDPTSQNGIYPGTKLFNQDFTEQSLRDNISGRRILHIATHGSFVPGNPEDSFLVLGNGQKLSISAIKSITDLANTHLVVLSACETGKGGVDKEGIEVAGIGHYFLLSGAKSVLASLWLVNDPATSLLMNRFYTNLSQGNLSKAEALRQVQIAFINGKLTDTEAKALNRAGVRLYREGQLPHGSFAHPYYWAPFILIGNNL